MSVFKIVGSIIDTSGAAGRILLQQVRYIRADTVSEARGIWARMSGGTIWDKVSLVPGGNLAAQNIGSSVAYDKAVETLDKVRPGGYRAAHKPGFDYERHLLRLDEIRASKARAKLLRVMVSG